MPIKILHLQRRFAEQGRIRLGYQAPTDKGGTRPAKLDKFRFTSPSEQHIKDLAALYGGEARSWDNHGKPEWEVYSDAKSIPVIAVKGGLSQWMEYWSGGGCVHRCDGEVNVLTSQPCDLDEMVTVRVRGRDVQVNPHTEAKPTTRLSLMLPELESIGVWRLESKGWNAAAEIPAVAELAQFVGDLVPASLDLVERRAIKDGKTSRFVVPVLDLKIATHRLRELVEAKVNGVPALSAGSGPAAIEAAPSTTPDYRAEADAAGDLEGVRAVWKRAAAAGDLDEDLKKYLMDLSVKHDDTAKAAAEGSVGGSSAAAPDGDGVVDAEIVPNTEPVEDEAAIWQQIVTAGGERGMTLGDIEDSFAEHMDGLTSAEASASELRTYLEHLTSTEVPAA